MWPNVLDIPKEQCTGLLRNLGINTLPFYRSLLMKLYRMPGLHKYYRRLSGEWAADRGEEVKPGECGQDPEHLQRAAQSRGQEGGQ